MKILHAFLCFLLFGSGLLVSSAINPVESVLFLILTFCNAAAILFIFNTEFLGLIFVIIYVGAIAVLFLFVIMMLNVKIQDQQSLSFSIFKSSYVIRFFSVYLIFILIFLVYKSIFSDYKLIIDTSTSILNFDSLNNIDVLGQFLYNYFLVSFLLAGLILLIALVGAIVLTLKFSSLQKGQLVYRQLSRTDNFLSFFK
jgi:NADH-quinone oxidoreductase subunit J